MQILPEITDTCSSDGLVDIVVDIFLQRMDWSTMKEPILDQLHMSVIFVPKDLDLPGILNLS